MDERQLSGISVCIMYALLTAACFAYVALGLATDCGTQEFVLELPLFVQLLVAEAIGLKPALAWLYEWAGWKIAYATMVLGSVYPLYWIGWWIAWFEESRDTQARAPATVPAIRDAVLAEA